ncbi:hypothetical protein HYN59_14955 [Flavobacterium album]|uniref:Polymerase nucleotidyl transferase domain-containing protein n=1 Tax=Flavobacterium album TaxID=2175091 RepID=A0A2S1R166_9FLAO|nr:hypothetical protein HYN59_14955 [Flavobacterium album]
MEVNIINEIKTIAERYCDHSFFVFGSYITNGKTYGDIDILIIYKTIDHIEQIRRDFQKINSYEIFHLMFLSYEEEEEIKFIKKVEAVDISGNWQL